MTELIILKFIGQNLPHGPQFGSDGAATQGKRSSILEGEEDREGKEEERQKEEVGKKNVELIRHSRSRSRSDEKHKRKSKSKKQSRESSREKKKDKSKKDKKEKKKSRSSSLKKKRESTPPRKREDSNEKPKPMPIILKSDLIDETLEKSRQDNIAHLKQRIEDTRREEEEARREDNTVIVTSLSLKAIERDIYGFFNQVNPDHPVRTHQGYQTDQRPSQLQIQRHRICRVLLPRCTRQRCRDEREGIHGL